jgi:hypothetical protein
MELVEAFVASVSVGVVSGRASRAAQDKLAFLLIKSYDECLGPRNGMVKFNFGSRECHVEEFG